MRFSATVLALSVVGSNADGVRMNRVAKSSKSGSAGSMDAGSWWGPAPAPATWGPAPTWAAPAPAPATWAAPATWSAPAPVVTDGCRAIWMPTVSESTFSADKCTLSGWWAGKIATKGIINDDNKITLPGITEGTAVVTGGVVSQVNQGNSGFNFLYSIVDILDVDQSNSAGASLSDNYNIPGFITDVTLDTEANPLTTVGLSYCQCKALAEWDCDALPTQMTNDATLAAGVITAPGTATTGAVTSSLFAEYAVVSLALRRIGGNTDAPNLVTTGAVTISSETEKNEVSALLNNLDKKLNRCAIMQQSSYDSA